MPHLTSASFLRFAHQHDDLPAFHAAYLLLTFIAAALFNLGFFALLIVAHMGLDIFKYRDVHGFGWLKTMQGVVRESIVDISLLCMGMIFAMYLHPSLTGLMGVKGLMLAELTILRGIGVMAPKLKILYDLLAILSTLDQYLSKLHPRFGKKISMVEYVCMFSICISVALLIAAPIMLHISAGQFLLMLVDEMKPWKI